MDVEQFICQHIVRALGSGLVPARGLGRIAVGREEELKHLRADLEFSQKGGAWVRCLSGDYGVGKTFFCSLVREEAWHRGFVVAAVDLGRDAPLHRFDVIYHRIMNAMRTVYFREVPAFEFILQEWLFNLEQGVQRLGGLNPLTPAQRGELSAAIARRIDEQLAKLRIYDRSFVNALHAYYEASRQGNEATATTAVGWLKGDVNLPADVRQELQLRERFDNDKAFNFLRAVVALVVHIGYAGLIVVFDESESIRSISRPDSRNAAYENICYLMDRTAHGEFAHCGFLLAGTEDLYNDAVRGVASYQALYERLKPDWDRPSPKDSRHPLMQLVGFDRDKLHEVALRVRQVHGVAYGWDAIGRLPDDMLKRLTEQTAVQFGGQFITAPRGFLKGLVDILDALHRSPPSLAGEILAAGIDSDCVEAVEREETHLNDQLG